MSPQNQLSFPLKYSGKLARSVLIEIVLNTDHYFFDLRNFFRSKSAAYRELCLYGMCLQRINSVYNFIIKGKKKYVFEFNNRLNQNLFLV